MDVQREEELSFPSLEAGRTGALERLLRLGRGLGVALAIALFWSGAFVLAQLLVPCLPLIERDPLARRRRIQKQVAEAWGWFLRVLERATLFRVRIAQPVWQEGPAVYVANHPSLLDVTAIIAHIPHACCVVKGSLMTNPLVGRLLRACGHVSAGDGGLSAGVKVMEELRGRLQEGFSVLVFPEGTRSPKGGMHRFRRGAFEVARLAGVPVVPLFLEVSPPALGKGTPLWEHPLACPTLTLHGGEALEPTQRDADARCRQLESNFRSRLVSGRREGEVSP
jgi:1-acyl-sn-glycerol-3-phosphate acyltransferase